MFKVFTWDESLLQLDLMRVVTWGEGLRPIFIAYLHIVVPFVKYHMGYRKLFSDIKEP